MIFSFKQSFLGFIQFQKTLHKAMFYRVFFSWIQICIKKDSSWILIRIRIEKNSWIRIRKKWMQIDISD